jgi:hypothetical protein
MLDSAHRINGGMMSVSAIEVVHGGCIEQMSVLIDRDVLNQAEGEAE